MGTVNNIAVRILVNAFLSVLRPIVALFPVSILLILVNLLILSLIIIG